MSIASCSTGSSATPCSSSRDCEHGELCSSGTCIAVDRPGGCSAETDCAIGEYCDIVDRRCKPLTLVGFGADAGANVPDAAARVDVGFPGTDAGLTNADADLPDSCSADIDCGLPPSMVCVANQCVPGCAEPGGLTCTGGTICDVRTGHCQSPSSSCNADQDCDPAPPTQICEANQCVFGCVVDSTRCAAGLLVCDTNTGRCVSVQPGCRQDTDCPGGPPARICVSSQCVPGCDQPGGVQCVGATSVCNAGTGRCDPSPGCAADGDCNDPDLICVNSTCTARCDRPGATACTAPQVCDSGSGRCVPGQLGLGVDCQSDVQCTSELCLSLTIGTNQVQRCSTPCGASSDCPVDFRCESVSGMRFCLGENVYNPPGVFDTPAGSTCTSASISCQSGWCDTRGNQCLESCSRNNDCTGFGGNCWSYAQTSASGISYAHLCVSQPGAAAGQSCTADDECESGICNRVDGVCATQCCAMQDCGAGESCRLYALDTNAGELVKICASASSSAGTTGAGAACTQGSDCQSGLCIPERPDDPASPRKCSTTCCRESDCAALPSGGRCRAFAGPTLNNSSTLVGACVPG